MKKWRVLVPLATVVVLLVLLIAPVGASAASNEWGGGSGCVKWHYVRCGQTLSGIARYYGTSVSHLAAINGIRNPNRIYAGTYLCVRTAAHPAPPKPAPRPGPGPGPKHWGGDRAPAPHTWHR